jgi:predicted short-subunit dehydrogenase-like oxidoreductase (DUF2520 family)
LLPAELTATWGDGAPSWIPDVEVIILAVQDDRIEEVAGQLADSGKIEARHTVFHLSGVLDHTVLRRVRASGAAIGSFHPLQTFTDPESAVERLKGSVASIEGDPRAVEMGERLAETLGMRPVRIRGGAKSRYHAGAVFASNYVVAVAEVARQILVDAGLSPDLAWKALQGLLRGTFESLEVGLPQDALTGPISRGDAATVRKHLSLLRGTQAELYRQLGRVALDLADLPPDQREEVARALKPRRRKKTT